MPIAYCLLPDRTSGEKTSIFGTEFKRGNTIKMEAAMRSIGVICEYNPFHNGHAAQLRRIREEFGPETGIVCLMSGNYVQRGAPAIFPKALRAEAAVLCGADLVLELPLTAALSSAEGFAACGVEILTAFGCEGLSFGSECGDRDLLMSTARANLDPAFDALLRDHLAAGCSYPTARQRAWERLTAEEEQKSLPLEDRAVRGTARFYPQLRSYAAEMGSSAQVAAPQAMTDEVVFRVSLLSRPNDILGVEYCKAILKQGSPLRPLPIRRPGDYHAAELDPEAPSATALRAELTQTRGGGQILACLQGRGNGRQAGGGASPDLGMRSRACHSEQSEESASSVPGASSWPSAVPACLRELYQTAPVHTMAAGERAVLAVLRTLPDGAFAALPFGAEGLWSKLMKNCRACASAEEILEATKSKRYTRTRIQRMLLCAVLGLTAADLQRRPPYVRVLAFNDRGRALLRAYRERQAAAGPALPLSNDASAAIARLPLINAGETPPDRDYFALESRAADLYSLFSAEGPRPAGEETRLRVRYLPCGNRPSR